MYALPAAPPPSPRRQLFVGTALACVGGAALFGGLLALYLRFRDAALSMPGGEWRPASAVVPEVATNIMWISFAVIGIMCQWAVYAARRDNRSHTALALGLVALVALAVINGQAFTYFQMNLGARDGTYQTMFYAVTGTFLVFMLIGLVYTVVTAFRFLGGRTRDRELVSAHAMYWYFMCAVYTAIWFVIYVTK